MQTSDQLTEQAKTALASGIPEDELLTPIVAGVRVVMRVRGFTWKRGPGFKGMVTDLLTGKNYETYGKRCSLPNCWCDLEAVDMDGRRA